MGLTNEYTFYMSGALRASRSYDDNWSMQGKQVAYFECGSIKTKGSWLNNEKIGLWLYNRGTYFGNENKDMKKTKYIYYL